MSSKAMASALLSYGSDLKIKNIVLEMFFSALPAIYMSKFKLIDPNDELIVDLFYQYVKATLKERGEYGIIVQALMLETYPDLDLPSMTPPQVSLLGELAIKRIVYQAIDKIHNKIYLKADEFFGLQDPTADKQNFLDNLMLADPDYLIPFLNVENREKISFLNKDGYIRNFKSTDPKPAKERRWWRNPGIGKLQGADFHQGNNTDFSMGLDSPYKGTTFCFEPYIRLETKELDEIVLCSKDLGGKPAAISLQLKQLVKMFMMFSEGDGDFQPSGDADPFSAGSIGDLSKIANKSCVCSIEDLNAYFRYRVQKTLNGHRKIGANSGIGNALDAVFKSISLGVRCTADVVPNEPNDKAAYNALTGEMYSLSHDPGNKAFAEKTLFYLEPVLWTQNKKTKEWTHGYEYHFTTVLAKKEQVFTPNKIMTVIAEGKKWDTAKIRTAFKATSLPPKSEIVESIFVELLKTKEFDALIKSVFVPAMLYNTIATVPNLEIGRGLIPIMRQSGVFSGLDEVLNGMFSSLESYLTGDFPWMKGCGDLL